MPLHSTSFEYLKPTDEQLMIIDEVRGRFKEFAIYLNDTLPDGPDKTFIMRSLRDIGMWANVCITRNPDGSPRT